MDRVFAEKIGQLAVDTIDSMRIHALSHTPKQVRMNVTDTTRQFQHRANQVFQCLVLQKLTDIDQLLQKWETGNTLDRTNTKSNTYSLESIPGDTAHLSTGNMPQVKLEDMQNALQCLPLPKLNAERSLSPAEEYKEFAYLMDKAANTSSKLDAKEAEI